MPPPCCSVSAASRRFEKIPSIESAIVPITKQLKSVTARSVPAPARMRPAGRKQCPASASANSAAHLSRCSGDSACAAACATRANVSCGSRSSGVPSGAFRRYFMSQIWREMSVIKLCRKCRMISYNLLYLVGQAVERRAAMPKIDVDSVAGRKGSGYPAPFHEIAKGRTRKPLGGAAGLTQFGVNLLTLPPGAASSQRHWHSAEDEFVYVVSGEVTLMTDRGQEILRTGDCAGFPMNNGNGHQLVNRSSGVAVCLEIGTR